MSTSVTMCCVLVHHSSDKGTPVPLKGWPSKDLGLGFGAASEGSDASLKLSQTPLAWKLSWEIK